MQVCVPTICSIEQWNLASLFLPGENFSNMIKWIPNTLEHLYHSFFRREKKWECSQVKVSSGFEKPIKTHNLSRTDIIKSNILDNKQSPYGESTQLSCIEGPFFQCQLSIQCWIILKYMNTATLIFFRYCKCAGPNFSGWPTNSNK